MDRMSTKSNQPLGLFTDLQESQSDVQPSGHSFKTKLRQESYLCSNLPKPGQKPRVKHAMTHGLITTL